jgi:pSer/pThr/pTyr-binding forkhead associated (FHA) protein
LERILIGRVNGHDIVLRHGSVSKFHAWFEVREDGHLYVGDAGSRNYTYVNGERIMDRTRVQPGAKLTFGLLDAHVYTLESFWKALNPGA